MLLVHERGQDPRGVSGFLQSLERDRRVFHLDPESSKPMLAICATISALAMVTVSAITGLPALS